MKYFSQHRLNHIEIAPSLHTIVSGEIVAEHTIIADATAHTLQTLVLETVLRAFPDNIDLDTSEEEEDDDVWD